MNLRIVKTRTGIYLIQKRTWLGGWKQVTWEQSEESALRTINLIVNGKYADEGEIVHEST